MIYTRALGRYYYSTLYAGKNIEIAQLFRLNFIVHRVCELFEITVAVDVVPLGHGAGNNVRDAG